MITSTILHQNFQARRFITFIDGMLTFQVLEEVRSDRSSLSLLWKQGMNDLGVYMTRSHWLVSQTKLFVTSEVPIYQVFSDSPDQSGEIIISDHMRERGILTFMVRHMIHPCRYMPTSQWPWTWWRHDVILHVLFTSRRIIWFQKNMACEYHPSDLQSNIKYISQAQVVVACCRGSCEPTRKWLY